MTEVEYPFDMPARYAQSLWLAAVLAMMSVAGGISGSSCTRPEEQHRTPVRQSECVVCHEPEYLAATEPRHAGVFPTTCNDCHGTATWAGAASHPEERFPIATGDHAQFECSDCHVERLGPLTDGVNVDCGGCHTGAHSETTAAGRHATVADYRWEGDTNPRFCLRCHPTGEQADHPEDRFPIETGDHAGYACTDCHDASLGPDTDGLNTDCGGCHLGAHNEPTAAGRHRNVPDYEWKGDTNPSFCLECHPTGRQSDGTHPEARFPISVGDHSDFACGDCHDRSLGPDDLGLNTDCGGCHTGAHSRETAAFRHRNVRTYQWEGDTNPHFCLECHPRGVY